MLLSPHQVSPRTGAERSASVQVLLDALCGLIGEVLALHDDGTYRVVRDMDWRFVGDAADQRDVRLSVMGDPARYVTVRWTGDTGADGYETGVTAPHTFEVFVARGTGDGARPGPSEADYAAAEAAFRGLCEGEGVFDGTDWTSPPGLLYALRRQRVLVTETPDGTYEIEVGQPQILDTPQRRRPDAGDNPDDRHELRFSVTLT